MIGANALGLSRLPVAWVPPSLAISVELCALTRRGATPEQLLSSLNAVFPEIEKWRSEKATGPQILVRSSATFETILDRGRFISLPVEEFTLASLAAAASSICNHFLQTGAPGEMALILQPHKQAVVQGHLANIRRVSKTRNQWEYEISQGELAFQFEPTGRFNSQRSTSPPIQSPLLRPFSDEELREALKQIANWCATEIDPVISLEWLIDKDALWLVQCDDEVAPPGAIRPQTEPLPRSATATDAAPAPFQLYRLGDHTEIRKLSLLNDLSPTGFSAKQAIYFARGDELQRAVSTPAGLNTLSEQISNFAPDGVVVRTELVHASGGDTINLPRTETVEGRVAVQWIGEKLRAFASKGVLPNSVAFLMHRFIPARAAAWSFFSPGDRYVQVDALWGLPDGIQYFPPDTYEFDLVLDDCRRMSVDYKPYVLWPCSGGTWDKLHVDPLYARRQCLSQANIRRIARHTAAISESSGKPVQIMWFCDFPVDSPYNDPLPWYMMEDAKRPPAQRAAPALPQITVRDKAALDELLVKPRCRLLLDPEPALIRDKQFLDLVIAKASEGGHSVVLMGSNLAHAYSQFTSAGLTVYSLRPAVRQRTVRKRAFGKLVRDKIPEIIASRGEAATFGSVPIFARKRLLIAKAIEELWELAEADKDAQNEEVADLYEVVTALLHEIGSSWDAVRSVALKKQQERGGFTNGYVLLGTSVPAPTSAPLLPIIDDRQRPVRPAEALRAASAIEVEGKTISMPFFSLMDPDEVTTATVVIGQRAITVNCRIEADRLIVDLSADGHEDDGGAGASGVRKDR
jgi:predicted house-cleaning noncanonical NTP pyrophosphatase (MazG superfamily)